MGLQIMRLGDFTTGHGEYPPVPFIEASIVRVVIGGIPLVTVGDAHAVHCKPGNHDCHGGVVVAGSSRIFAGGRPLVRTGDPCSDGDFCGVGSSIVSD